MLAIGKMKILNPYLTMKNQDNEVIISLHMPTKTESRIID